LNPDECDSFKYHKHDEGNAGFGCHNHSPGTMLAGVIVTGGKQAIQNVVLGLPKGFDRCGPVDFNKQGVFVRLFDSTDQLEGHWNELNIPVWAMERDGFLFVRTYMPRINTCYVDVIHNGSREALVPSAVDVGVFADQID
tara:strand:+ start:4616 stop:5035 length:420 start_codon:yes stop_codon:yes gene_type:complete